MTSMSTLQAQVHQTAVDHGWWEADRGRTFGDTLALIHSEVSEALEEHRNGRGQDEIYWVDGKPEGIPVEIADVIIRCLDWFSSVDLDSTTVVQIKNTYNETRPMRHGGKAL